MAHSAAGTAAHGSVCVLRQVDALQVQGVQAPPIACLVKETDVRLDRRPRRRFGPCAFFSFFSLPSRRGGAICQVAQNSRQKECGSSFATLASSLNTCFCSIQTEKDVGKSILAGVLNTTPGLHDKKLDPFAITSFQNLGPLTAKLGPCRCCTKKKSSPVYHNGTLHSLCSQIAPALGALQCNFPRTHGQSTRTSRAVHVELSFSFRRDHDQCVADQKRKCRSDISLVVSWLLQHMVV